MAPGPAEDNRTLVIVWDGTFNGDMATINANASAILVDVIKNTVNANPGWFYNFVGIVFRDSTAASHGYSVISNVVSNTDYTAFANHMQIEISSANGYTAPGPARDIFTGLIAALTYNTTAIRSQAFVVTNGYAEDVVTENAVLDALAISHTAVSMMVIGDDGPPGNAFSIILNRDYRDFTKLCDNTNSGGGNSTSMNVQSMFETCHISGGQLYQVLSLSLKCAFKKCDDSQFRHLPRVWLLIGDSYYRHCTTTSTSFRII